MMRESNAKEVDLYSLSKEELINKVNELNNRINMQENFMLNIVHDLKNPINIILSILQCMKYTDGEEAKEKRQEYRDMIKKNGLKMIKLINNLIDSSKLEGNNYNLEKRKIDIVSLVENTVMSIEKYAEQKQIQLVFDTNVEECVMIVDIEAIERIVLNLLSNAIKFSSKDKEILTYVHVQDNQVKISVKDNGRGIPESEQKNIFNRFIQSENNKKREDGGSGIGLDLVNYLTKLHGGTVELKSKEGEGSEFTIVLPRTEIIKDNVDYRLISNNSEQLEIEFSDVYL